MLLPFPPAFPTRSLPGEGRSSPAVLTPSPRQRGHTGRNGPGVWACGAAASWPKRSMDSLFVEEVAASLVREFLSRKVRGAILTVLGSCLIVEVGEGSSLETFRLWRPFGMEPFPCRLPALEMPSMRAPFPGLLELHFPGAISVSAHFLQAGTGQRPLLEVSFSSRLAKPRPKPSSFS